MAPSLASKNYRNLKVDSNEEHDSKDENKSNKTCWYDENTGVLGGLPLPFLSQSLRCSASCPVRFQPPLDLQSRDQDRENDHDQNKE
jgi:hypothetical protein